MKRKRLIQNRFFRLLVLLCVCLLTGIFCLSAGAAMMKPEGKLTFTKEEQAYIREHPQVTIAMDTSWIPYCYKTKEGNIEGILPNIINSLSAATALNIELRPYDSYAAAIWAARSGETMLVSGIADDPVMAQKNQMKRTEPYIQINYSGVTKKSIEDIFSEGTKYRVAVCKASYANVVMEKKMPTYEFMEYDSNEECMDAVVSGECELALVAAHAVEYYSNIHRYSSLNTTLFNDFNWGLCIGVNQNCDDTLVSILNKGIAHVTRNHTDQAIYRGLLSAVNDTSKASEWFYRNPVIGALLLLLFFVLIGIILFFIILRKKDERYNAKLYQALKEAEEANKAKTQFLSRMSHDMRTPMNGILGLVDLSEGETEAAVLHESMGKIRQSGQYLLGLINDTLDFQKIESGRMNLELQAVRAKVLLDTILELVTPLAEKKRVHFVVENRNMDLNWYIRTDSMRMKQIFVNLLSNAVKFTPEGGTVIFRFECLGREGMISHNRVSIMDTGIGMSEEFLKNGIFKPFSQENNKNTAVSTGSGLGLSITKSLVEMMGGHIEVESELGKGSTFQVYMDFERLDLKDVEKDIQAEARQGQEIKRLLAGKRILLAEDHPLNAEISRRLLEKADCQVTWSENGKMVLDAFNASETGYFDAILMDIRMPVMDGLEAAARIRASDRADAREIPIIAMTANAYTEDKTGSLKAGMNDHLSKPVNAQKMYETIARLIGERKKGEMQRTRL